MLCKNRWVLCYAVGLLVSSASSFGDAAQPASLQRMADAAHLFATSLSDDQKATTLFPLDSEERFGYHLRPDPVSGIRLKDMSLEQLSLMHALLSSSLSANGYHKSASIIALEAYVHTERAARGPGQGARSGGRRGPGVGGREGGPGGRGPGRGGRGRGGQDRVEGIENYSIAIFGDPSATGTWAWRIHGHHLSIAFSVADGKSYVAAPAFLGAQPHYVASGPRKGWNILGEEEKLGRALMNSLDESQQKTATIADQMPRLLLTGNERKISLDAPDGIAFSDLNEAQQSHLRDLVQLYIDHVPADVASSRMQKVEEGGWDNVHFGWIGSLKERQANYYCVQGPEFLIEYSMVGPNHVHVVWRDRNGDFGADILADHLANSPH